MHSEGEQAVPVDADQAVPPVNAEQAMPPVIHAQPPPRSAGEPVIHAQPPPSSAAGEALQARLDEVICVHLLDRDPAKGMQLIGNCFTSCDGTDMRQFVVSATGSVRCAICDNDTPLFAKHCGQYASERSQPQTRAHLRRAPPGAGYRATTDTCGENVSKFEIQT